MGIFWVGMVLAENNALNEIFSGASSVNPWVQTGAVPSSPTQVGGTGEPVAPRREHYIEDPLRHARLIGNELPQGIDVNGIRYRVVFPGVSGPWNMVIVLVPPSGEAITFYTRGFGIGGELTDGRPHRLIYEPLRAAYWDPAANRQNRGAPIPNIEAIRSTLLNQLPELLQDRGSLSRRGGTVEFYRQIRPMLSGRVGRYERRSWFGYSPNSGGHRSGTQTSQSAVTDAKGVYSKQVPAPASNTPARSMNPASRQGVLNNNLHSLHLAEASQRAPGARPVGGTTLGSHVLGSQILSPVTGNFAGSLIRSIFTGEPLFTTTEPQANANQLQRVLSANRTLYGTERERRVRVHNLLVSETIGSQSSAAMAALRQPGMKEAFHGRVFELLEAFDPRRFEGEPRAYSGNPFGDSQEARNRLRNLWQQERDSRRRDQFELLSLMEVGKPGSPTSFTNLFNEWRSLERANRNKDAGEFLDWLGKNYPVVIAYLASHRDLSANFSNELSREATSVAPVVFNYSTQAAALRFGSWQNDQ